MITDLGGELGHDESLSEQEILTAVLITGVAMLYEHQGWVSTSWTLIQVSNVVSPNVNGKSQLLHPVGILYCDQMARNPEPVPPPLVMNLRLTEFVFVMMENGVDISDEVPISPQYFSSSICNQSYLHVL